jgi:aspartate 1-decarboxylase
MRTFVAAKVHGMRVTNKSLHYNGSQTIPVSVMRAAGILPYEQVHCLNMSNGARWVTYAVPGPETVCSLNGAAARQGEVGDELILITYQAAVAFPGAKVIFCEANRPARSLDYDSDAYALDSALELDQLDCLGTRTQ